MNKCVFTRLILELLTPITPCVVLGWVFQKIRACFSLPFRYKPVQFIELKFPRCFRPLQVFIYNIQMADSSFSAQLFTRALLILSLT